MSEDIMTVKDVSEYLKIPEKTVYKYALEGTIPGFKVGGSWRFRRDEIEQLTKQTYNKAHAA